MKAQRIYMVALLMTSLFVSISSPAFSVSTPQVKSAKPIKPAANATKGSSEEDAIRVRIGELTKALTNADAKIEASLWADDGVFVDENGKEWRGQAELEKRFTAIFNESGKQLVNLIPHKIRLLSNNIAMAYGVVQDKDGGTTFNSSHFSILYVKQNGKWMISMATEKPIFVSQGQPVASPLHALDWLVGEWLVERNGKSVHIKYEWMADKNFIQTRYVIDDAKEPEKSEMQIIGFDPRSGQIVSWNFNANGEFGHGVWFKKDNQWLVDKTSIAIDGSTIKSTLVITEKDKNTYSWQSVARTVNGVESSDTAVLEVKRQEK